MPDVETDAQVVREALRVLREDHGDWDLSHDALAGLDRILAELAQAKALTEARSEQKAGAMLRELQADNTRLREALERIAGMDYRGNEPLERSIARAALDRGTEE